MTNRYKNGKIYTIRNYVDDGVYVGSTCNPLHKRFYQHKEKSRGRKSNMKLHQHMRKLGLSNFYIELHEEYPCKNVQQLRRREGQIMRELKSSLNKYIAGRTQKEYYEENKQEILERTKQWHKHYYIKNKEAINAKGKEYRNKNKDKERERKTNYRLNNKSKIRATQRKYRRENIDKIRIRKKAYRNKHREHFKVKHQQYYEHNDEFYEKTKHKLNFHRRMKRWKPKLEKHLKTKYGFPVA